MLVFNFTNLVKVCEKDINYYLSRLPYEDQDDYRQEILIYIYRHINKLDLSASSLHSFLCLMILTCFRKIIYDKTQQVIFEKNLVLFENFSHLVDSCFFANKYNIDDIITYISQNIENRKTLFVFYGLLYNDKLTYLQISRKINIPINELMIEVDKIKSIISENFA